MWIVWITKRLVIHTTLMGPPDLTKGYYFKKRKQKVQIRFDFCQIDLFLSVNLL